MKRAKKAQESMTKEDSTSSTAKHEPYHPGSYLELATCFLLIGVNVFIPTFFYLLLFSNMTAAGQGIPLYKFLRSHYYIAVVCGFLTFCIVVGTYVFDGFKYWRETQYKNRRIAVFGTVAFMVIVGSLFAAKEYPFLPIAIVLLLFLLYAYVVHRAVGWPEPKFLYYLWRALLFVSLGLYLFWICWVFAYGHEWNTEEKLEVADELNESECDIDSETNATCLQSFLIWFSPFLLATFELVFSVIIYFLNVYLTDETSGTKDLAFRVFITMVGLSCMSVWAAASVAGAGMELANAIVAFFFSATVWVGVATIAVFGLEEVRRRFFAIPVVKKIADSFLSDWFTALFIIMFFWIIVMYVLLSFLNQKFREFGWTAKDPDYNHENFLLEYHAKIEAEKQERMAECVPSTAKEEEEEAEAPETMEFDNRLTSAIEEFDKPLPTNNTTEGDTEINISEHNLSNMDEETKMLVIESAPIPVTNTDSCCVVTKMCAKQILQASYWEWTSISIKMVYWGIIYITLIVFTAKVVTMLLSWMAAVLEDWNLVVVILFFIGIGLVMFLLPPVPGTPVYLTGGIIIPGVAEKAGMSFGAAIILAALVCCVVKFMAIIIQQKGIGEYLGEQIWVRRFVGVNSLSIRAIEKILNQEGFKIDKICILIGGPDWPTSVLTGILHMNLGEMLIGSLPIAISLIPTSIAGSMLKKASEGGKWEALSGVTLTCAAMLNGLTFLSAGHFIEKTALKYEKELVNKKMDGRDQLVAALDEVAAVKSTIFYQEAAWPKLPRLRKIELVTSAVLMVLVCYMVGSFGSSCFHTFELTDSVYDKPIKSNPFNLVKPGGWVAFGLFFISIVLWWHFTSWAYKLVGENDEYKKAAARAQELKEAYKAQQAGESQYGASGGAASGGTKTDLHSS